MRMFSVSSIALAVGLYSSMAMADNLTKQDYKAAEQHIEAEHDRARLSCNSLSGNAKDICVEEVKGKRSIATADLKYQNERTVRARFQLHVTRADVKHAVAIEKCDEKPDSSKGVCVREAKIAKTRELAKAQVARKTAIVNIVANEQTRSTQRDAAERTQKVDYSVAWKKCEAFAGNAKGQCLASVKSGFDK